MRSALAAVRPGWRLPAIVGVSLLGSLADAASVYAIYVLGARLSGGAIVESGLSGDAVRLLERVSAATAAPVLLLIALAFLVAVLARGILRTAAEQMIVATQLRIWRDSGKALFHGYFRLPYEDFIGRNSVDRINSITAEATRAGYAVGNAIRTVLQALNVAVLVLLLLLVSPQAFLFAAAAGLLLFAIIRPIAGTTRAIGKQMGAATRDLWLAIVEPFRAYRVVVTSQAQEHFGRDVERKLDRNLALLRRSTLSQQLLAPVMELAVAAMVVAGVAIALFASANPSGAFPLVLLVLSGTYRIMPALSGLSQAFTAYRFNEPGLQHVQEELRAVAAPHEPPGLRHEEDATPGLLLALRAVGFAYRGGPPILSGVSLEVRAGQRVGVVGPSGAGKSTLVDLALGLLRPTEGHVALGRTRDGRKPRIAYLPQQVILMDATVLENLCLGQPPGAWDRAKAQRLLDQVGLGAGSERPVALDLPLAEGAVRISGGQRQRLGLARALYQEPDLLILDEPTAALDAESEAQVVDALARVEGLAMLVVTHREAPLRLCGEVLHLRGGRALPAAPAPEAAA